MYCEIEVATKNEKTVIFNNANLQGAEYCKDGITIKLSPQSGVTKVTVIPTAKDIRITKITYRIAINLRNFESVIIPDCGRFYSKQQQLVDFWGYEGKSTVNHIRIPLFIFTGLDHSSSFAYGIIGQPYETKFQCLEPYYARALSAYTRTLRLEIGRGIEGYPIPTNYLNQDDGSITEYLFIKDYPSGSSQSWLMTLREFCLKEQQLFGLQLSYDEGTLEPLWCSWTDWHSDNVTEAVILENVKQGVSLGIKNYIIDDGWFGPGLDSNMDTALNIGDWDVDPAKIKDLKALNHEIRKLGGRPLIWCAPHAVGAIAKCRNERLKYLCKDKNGELIETKNKFNVLCFRNAEAREIMANICVRLAIDFDTDGAKYDVFNCIPGKKCYSDNHDHDTDSMIEGLYKLLELIWKKIKRIKPNYIIELKQNYGGSYLAQFGSMMRAGDTPYNIDGNYCRTAMLQGYTPYTINDYQTITNQDKVEFSALMVIKMMAVGIPSYSMDMTSLSQEHMSMLKNYNEWYLRHLEQFKKFRLPVGFDLNVWKSEGPVEDIYFILNNVSRVKIDTNEAFTILNGSIHENIIIEGEPCRYKFKYYGCTGELIKVEEQQLNGITQINLPLGGRLEAINKC